MTPVDTIAPPVTGDAPDRGPAPEHSRARRRREHAPVAQAAAVVAPVVPAEPERVLRTVEPIAPVAVAEPQPMAQATDNRPTCTTAQLRRFIKSRPWVPMHELRRRFGVWGGDDDVSPMHVGDRTLFVGLPAAEAAMMAELLSGGDVGYELSLDPVTPIVVGVYPMRPVPRS